MSSNIDTENAHQDENNTETLESNSEAAASTKPAKEKFCIECNGPSAGRGWVHAESCSRNSIKQIKNNKAEKCPGCDGLRKGRGYAHNVGCSDVATRMAGYAAKYAANKPKNIRTCTVCNGPARGKGYRHTDGCSASSKAVKTISE